MLRIFGGVLVFIVSVYWGFYFSDRLKKRRDFLRAMSAALTFILTEIEFARYELENIFRRVEASPMLCGFFAMCIDGVGKCSMRNVWKNAVLSCAETAFLKDGDREVLLRLGEQIGMSDIEGQKNIIKRAITHLDENAMSADEEYQRLSKPYRSCGILLGVFFLIIIA